MKYETVSIPRQWLAFTLGEIDAKQLVIAAAQRLVLRQRRQRANGDKFDGRGSLLDRLHYSRFPTVDAQGEVFASKEGLQLNPITHSRHTDQLFCGPVASNL